MDARDLLVLVCDTCYMTTRQTGYGCGLWQLIMLMAFVMCDTRYVIYSPASYG